MGARFIVSVAWVELAKLLSDKNHVELKAINLMSKNIIPKMIETTEPTRLVLFWKVSKDSMDFSGITKKELKNVLREVKAIFERIYTKDNDRSDLDKAIKFCQSFCKIYPRDEDFFYF